MSDSIFLGIDIGTSSVKCAVLGEKGILGSALAEHPIESPRSGWAEQNPEVWITGIQSAVRQAFDHTQAQPADVQGLGLSGQMHGTVCLDQSGQVLRPAILWADQRSAPQTRWINDNIGEERLASWTGNPVAAGFTLPTLLWLRENEPSIWKDVRTVLLPKDYVRYRMVGELGSEPSDACSTLLFDTAKRSWSAPLLREMKIDRELLPEIHGSTAIAGELQAPLATEMGLPPGIPVVYGGGDQACQALSQGAIEPSLGTCTIGTGGQILVPIREPTGDSELRTHMFCHVFPDLWYLMAATLSAGLSFRWLRDNILYSQTYSQMADLAESAPPGNEGLIFLPYLVGERTPHMDPEARGAFIGLTRRHQTQHIIRAVMEGVVFSLRQGLDSIRQSHVQIDSLTASGGATKHPLWLQIMADVLEMPISVSTVQESAATGAAWLAVLGSNSQSVSDYAQWAASNQGQKTVQPIGGNVRIYQNLYPIYCDGYPALYG